MENKAFVVLPNALFFTEVKRHLQERKSVGITVKRNSMYPFLKNGQQVLLRPLHDMRIKTGDIVLAEIESGYVLHRVVKKNERFVTLAGDGNLYQKERADRDKVMAAVPTSPLRRIAGLTWYVLRPLRRIAYKIYASWIKPIKKSKT